MRFIFLKLLDRILLYLLSGNVRDNVISNDVTITSSLRSNVIIFGLSFLFFSKISSQDGPCKNYETVSKFDKVVQRSL